MLRFHSARSLRSPSYPPFRRLSCTLKSPYGSRRTTSNNKMINARKRVIPHRRRKYFAAEERTNDRRQAGGLCCCIARSQSKAQTSVYKIGSLSITSWRRHGGGDGGRGKFAVLLKRRAQFFVTDGGAESALSTKFARDRVTMCVTVCCQLRPLTSINAEVSRKRPARSNCRPSRPRRARAI